MSSTLSSHSLISCCWWLISECFLWSHSWVYRLSLQQCQCWSAWMCMDVHGWMCMDVHPVHAVGVMRAQRKHQEGLAHVGAGWSLGVLWMALKWSECPAELARMPCYFTIWSKWIQNLPLRDSPYNIRKIEIALLRPTFQANYHL